MACVCQRFCSYPAFSPESFNCLLILFPCPSSLSGFPWSPAWSPAPQDTDFLAFLLFKDWIPTLNCWSLSHAVFAVQCLSGLLLVLFPAHPNCPSNLATRNSLMTQWKRMWWTDEHWSQNAGSWYRLSKIPGFEGMQRNSIEPILMGKTWAYLWVSRNDRVEREQLAIERERGDDSMRLWESREVPIFCYENRDKEVSRRREWADARWEAETRVGRLLTAWASPPARYNNMKYL